MCYRTVTERRYRLRWNPDNVAHIWRHRVSVEEVEHVCDGDPWRERGQFGRTVLIRPTQSGRMLTVVLELLTDGTDYPVTARPASRKERQRHAKEKGGGLP